MPYWKPWHAAFPSWRHRWEDWRKWSPRAKPAFCAGAMRLNDERATPVWLPYVRVADAKAAAAAARAAGGKVLREPLGIGRAVVAVIADPTGAPVGIAQVDAEVQP